MVRVIDQHSWPIPVAFSMTPDYLALDYLAQHIRTLCIFIFPHPTLTPLLQPTTSLLANHAHHLPRPCARRTHLNCQYFPLRLQRSSRTCGGQGPSEGQIPATPPNLVARAKPSPERRNHAPRQAPSPKHDTATTFHERHRLPDKTGATTFHVHTHQPDTLPERSRLACTIVGRSMCRAMRLITPKRSPQRQNVFGNKIEDGLGWHKDQCPAPLSACPYVARAMSMR
ncbi:hypothetical protein BGY98DRAFT_668216 [Russula aff. rugulosa BPL654]|nr:hypothetical protein BGY98DRAFT_668216 [Russula aff. rugulosa BPL654]